jgi:hypothetical protein
MANRAITKASLRLQAKTGLSSEAALALLKSTAESVKGGGASVLSSAKNIGARVRVDSETASRLQLSVVGGRAAIATLGRPKPLCSFSAQARPSNSRTELVVGGLEKWSSRQERLLGVIPTGPVVIAGMTPYKRVLHAVSKRLQEVDPSAQITIAEGV